MSASAVTKSCFVICPISQEGSEIRKRADLILKYVITPAAEECGYTPVRADKISEPGLITSQIIERIINDPLVIADLTGSIPNVFYELALRHAVRRPFVQLVQKGENLPFDIAGMRTISIDHTDLESVAEAKIEIIKQIKSVEGKKPEDLYSPVTYAVDLQQLRKSENVENRSFGEILALTTEIRSEIQAISSRLAEPSDEQRVLRREVYNLRERLEMERAMRKQLEDGYGTKVADRETMVEQVNRQLDEALANIKAHRAKK